MLGKIKEEGQFLLFLSPELFGFGEEPSDVPHLAESFLFSDPSKTLSLTLKGAGPHSELSNYGIPGGACVEVGVGEAAPT